MLSESFKRFSTSDASSFWPLFSMKKQVVELEMKRFTP